MAQRSREPDVEADGNDTDADGNDQIELNDRRGPSTRDNNCKRTEGNRRYVNHRRGINFVCALPAVLTTGRGVGAGNRYYSTFR